MTTPVEFKQWIAHSQSPKVEQLLKEAATSEVISLAGGLPSDEMFPSAEFEEGFHRIHGGVEGAVAGLDFAG